MAKEFLEIKGAIRLIEAMGFEKNAQKNVIRRVTRKGGNIFKAEVRNQINVNNTPASNSKTKGGRSGKKYEHIDRIKKSVKTLTSKSRLRPGVNIYIKGPDVPVGQGKSRRFWKMSSYSNLVLFGNHNTSPRKKKSTKKSTGNVRGIAEFNPFKKAYNLKKEQASRAVVNALMPEIKKEIDKQRRRI